MSWGGRAKFGALSHDKRDGEYASIFPRGEQGHNTGVQDDKYTKGDIGFSKRMLRSGLLVLTK